MPVKDAKKKETSGLNKIAMDYIYSKIRHLDPGMEIEPMGDNRIGLRVRNDRIAKIIGRKGQNIERLEKQLGVRISVEPRENTMKGETGHGWEETGSYYYILVDPKLRGKHVDIYEGEEFLFSAIVGKGGRIKLKKKSDEGRLALQGHLAKKLLVFI